MNQSKKKIINFVPEKQAISNQLEMSSMASDVNSVMNNTSPIRSSKVMSTRNTKTKVKADK